MQEVGYGIRIWRRKAFRAPREKMELASPFMRTTWVYAGALNVAIRGLGRSGKDVIVTSDG